MHQPSQQIGVAAHNHCQAHGRFQRRMLPLGFAHLARRLAGRRHLGGGQWPGDLSDAELVLGLSALPFLEETALYLNPTDNVVNSTPIAAFYCPSRRPPIAIAGGYWASTSLPRAMTDYAGNGGSTTEGGNDAELGNGLNGIIVTMGLETIRFKDISDGTSKTILIGEKRMNVAFA